MNRVLSRTRRPTIRYFIGIALSLTLLGDVSKARADMVTYYLNGTVTSSSGFYGTSSPVAVGDRIRWMFQYDRSTPVAYSSANEGNIYNPTGPLISNIVDLTNGYHVPSPPKVGLYSQIQVLNYLPGNSGNILIQDSTPSSNPIYQAFYLTSKDPLPTLNLSNLDLNDIPFTLNPPSGYDPNVLNEEINSFQFNADINSLSTSISSTPEPGSLVLFTLGALGLALRRFRSWLGWQG